MKKFTYACISLAFLALIVGCGDLRQTSPETESTVQEIPVTTSNTEALADFRNGEELMDVGRFVEANRIFEASVKKDPEFAYGYLNIANTSASLVEFKTNLEMAKEKSAEANEGEKLLIDIALTFLNNDHKSRMALSQQLVEKYPQSPRAWLNLSSVQAARNEHENARASMSKILELDPEFVAAYSGLGFSYLFNEPKDFSLAEQNMSKMVQLRPEEGNGYNNLGDVYRGQNNLEKSLEAYTKGAELDPKNSVALLKKGHINSFLGNIDQARADYDNALEIAEDQNRASFANYKAFTYVHDGDPKGAINALESIMNSVSEMGTPDDQVIGTKIFTANNQAMIALYHNMLTESNNAVGTLNELLMAQAETVGTPEFKRTQEATVAYWEGLLAARQGDYETAMSKAEQNAMLLETDNNPRKMENYNNLMGLINLWQENYGEAVNQLEKANLNNLMVKYNLALAHEGAGNVEKAQQLIKEVAEWNFNSVAYALVRKEAKAKVQTDTPA